VWAGEGKGLARVEKDWIFVSDAHLTGRAPEAMAALVRFLDREKPRMSHLVILGDLFEFFFGFKNSSPKKGGLPDEKSFPFPEYLPVLNKILALHQAGIRIKYFEGNHDFFLRSFFREQFGMDVEVHSGGWEGRLEGRKAFLAHGDLSNPREWKYRFLRRILKNRWTYGMIQLAGPRFSRRVADWMSGKSHQLYHGTLPEEPPPAFRAFAHRKFREGFDLVVLGHSHFPEEVVEEIQGKPCLYFNVGDWMTHRSFLRFTPPDHFELARFFEAGQGIVEGRKQ
jgi:UDP-2,3-diacylglucosamine hydrolase